MRENLFAWVKKGEIMPQVCGYNEFQKLFEKSANPQPLLAEVFDPLPVKFLATPIARGDALWRGYRRQTCLCKYKNMRYLQQFEKFSAMIRIPSLASSLPTTYNFRPSVCVRFVSNGFGADSKGCFYWGFRLFSTVS